MVVVVLWLPAVKSVLLRVLLLFTLELSLWRVTPVVLPLVLPLLPPLLPGRVTAPLPGREPLFELLDDVVGRVIWLLVLGVATEWLLLLLLGRLTCGLAVLLEVLLGRLTALLLGRELLLELLDDVVGRVT